MRARADALPNRVRQFAALHALWEPEDRILVALSGGGDSVALALALAELAAEGDLRIAGIGHVHHHLRGEAADEDERFCRALAGTLGLPIRVAHIDVRALSAAAGVSCEVAARNARRAVLRAQAGELGASLVATAHTADDQAETVLLRLVRGTGIPGLGAMAPRAHGIVRPLLGQHREALRDWLRARGAGWREDETNTHLEHPRNRVRHQLLPYLRCHFNPSVDEALTRLADAARGDDSFLESVASAAVAKVVRTDGSGTTIDTASLRTLHPAVARRVVRAALTSVQPSRTYGLQEVDRVCAACLGAGNMPFDLRGLHVRRVGRQAVRLTRQITAPREPSSPGRVRNERGSLENAAVPHRREAL